MARRRPLGQHDPGLDRASLVRLSRGTGPIERTVSGWVAGVHGGRAYLLVPDGAELAIESMDTTGPVARLATVPPAPEFYRYHFAVTSAGEVVIAGGDVDRAGDVVLVGPSGTRRLSSLVEAGDGIRGVAADPRSPRIALVLQQIRGTPLIERGARLIVVDTAAGAVVSTRDLGPSVGQRGRHRLRRRRRPVDQSRRPARAHRRRRHAHVPRRHLPRHPQPRLRRRRPRHRLQRPVRRQRHDADRRPGCAVHYVPTTPIAQYVDAVLRFPGRCSFGIRLAMAGDTLWVAPP